MKMFLTSALALALAAIPAQADSASASLGVSLTVLPAGRAAALPLNVSFTPLAAAISVQRAGFSHIRLISRLADVFWFSAERGSGGYRLAVNARDGRVSQILPLTP